jgi:hypothetical protein
MEDGPAPDGTEAAAFPVLVPGPDVHALLAAELCDGVDGAFAGDMKPPLPRLDPAWEA